MSTQFDGVSVVTKANVYHNGKVISHTVLFADGSRKTIGLIYPGQFTFNTGEPEKMEIIAGSCMARVKGEEEWTIYPAGTFFNVPANSSFEISVTDDITEYICSFE